uniref:Uncharacterized protein n=1 Tax=Tanacetum cinerariifolium TaxID=118510 RepID=A0A6L2JGS6_TANCI|nr:hypothetical protein [Tanacetum cinerariifolium]
MKVIVKDFMQLSLKVTKRLKEKIKEEGSRIRKIEKITSFGVDDVEDFKEYTLMDYYYWLKTYYCWYKLKLLDNAA